MSSVAARRTGGCRNEQRSRPPQRRTVRYTVRINGPANDPVGTREVLFTDARFVDTPGWSHAMMPGGDVVYLQSPADLRR